ncbi:MAG: Uma2 family endonuclease [Chloroherpetonaceae bacterium]
MAQVLTKKMTREEYLEFERNSEERYEFVNGKLTKAEVAKRLHELLVATITAILFPKLRGTEWNVYSSNLKISIDSVGNYRYADVSIIRGEASFVEEDITNDATVLFEVLSKATEGIDRGEKFEEYQTLASLKEYVLVSTEKVQVEIYRRQNRREWTYQVLQNKSDKLELQSIGVEMALAEIYKRINL